MRRWKKIATETRGSEIAEAAFVLPLVFLLLLGIVWFGRAFNVYATINRAAREGAQVAVAPSCATCGNVFPDPTYIQNNVVNPILNAAHLDPSQVQAFQVLPVQLNPGSTPVELGTSVSFNYPYGFRLNGLTCCPLALTPINMGITLSAQAQARHED
jgi:hypothetical protein